MIFLTFFQVTDNSPLTNYEEGFTNAASYLCS